MVADGYTAATLPSEGQPQAGAGEYALPVQDSGSACLSDLCLSIASFPPSLLLTHTCSQDFLQVKCSHVEPGAVRDLSHLPSVLSKHL